MENWQETEQDMTASPNKKRNINEKLTIAAVLFSPASCCDYKKMRGKANISWLIEPRSIIMCGWVREGRH